MTDPSPGIRVRALVLASEALWWLGHFDDARVAAARALELEPQSAQARWRLAVAHYRMGSFADARKDIDALLAVVNAFAPAWALRGRVKLWEDPGATAVAASDFDAAAELDPAAWVVPVRIAEHQFQGIVRSAYDAFIKESGGDLQFPPLNMELLPARAAVARGLDPDAHGAFFNPPGPNPDSPFPIGGDFDGGVRTEVKLGANLALFQRNIENRCQTLDALRREVEVSVLEDVEGALRIHDDHQEPVPDNRPSDADGPGEDE